jgi:hypothetical protein
MRFSNREAAKREPVPAELFQGKAIRVPFFAKTKPEPVPCTGLTGGNERRKIDTERADERQQISTSQSKLNATGCCKRTKRRHNQKRLFHFIAPSGREQSTGTPGFICSLVVCPIVISQRPTVEPIIKLDPSVFNKLLPFRTPNGNFRFRTEQA